MTAHIELLRTNYLALLGGISYLADGGTITAAADPGMMLNITNISPPFALLVFNGEVAKTPTAIREAGAIQQTEMEWSVFIGKESFSATGEGILGTTGIYQMIDDVIDALQGAVVYSDPPARPFYVRSRRYSITPNLVIYEVVVRNAFTREAT